MTKEELDNFENVVEQGFVKICSSTGLLDGMLSSPDVDGKWEDFIKDYTADAVSNFNEYPEAALGFAGFLGAAVAHRWDKAWDVLKDEPYSSYLGSRGWDNMDDHITGEMLHLTEKDAARFSETMISCATLALAFIRRSGIEPQTADGFYALVRTCGAMYRVGAAVELKRLGYKKVALKL